MKFKQLLSVALIAIFSDKACSLEYEEILSSVKTSNSEDYRLPNNAIPIHYELSLIPYLENENFTFAGEVEIRVEILNSTSSITLHIDDLEILRTVVRNTNGSEINSTVTYSADSHFLTIDFQTPLSPDDYLINILYVGESAQDDLKGFYRSYYNTSTGELRPYASTFFAPIYARRAFPCFDEPAFKSTFNISIAHFQNQTVISNTLNESTSLPNATIGGRVWTKFQETPLMSTYLVAFMLFDFDYQANQEESFKIWFRPEARESANFSLAGESLLNELSTFTNISYFDSMLPKMDQVALPLHYPTAMENWGLITYREAWLLWQEGVSTTRDKQNIAVVGSHEFSHQWFGNLVTPEWWDYIWLSEGFAEFFGYYITDKVYPSWRLMEQFTVEVCQSALLADSLNTTSPLNRNVNSPDEINSVFDIISYRKGACLVRMLSILINGTTFQEGLQNYLKVNSYKTVNPEKLWTAFTEVDDTMIDGLASRQVNVTEMIDTWTNQKGYPVITVSRNYTTRQTSIVQEPFLINGRGSSNETGEKRWWIPFNLATQSDLSFFDEPFNWIRGEEETLFSPIVRDDEWMILNGQQAGFYRVNYDERNWRMLSEFLRTANFTDIPAGARAQLIDDAFNLARGGYLNYEIALDLARYLTRETDYIPWAAAFNSFSFLNTILSNSNGYQNFRTYLFRLVLPIHNSLGYVAQESDEHVTNYLRSDSHSLACQMGCPGCNSQARQLVQNYFDSNGNNSIAVDLKSWAYCEGLREASIEVWNFMLSRYLLTDISGEQSLIISGLGCSLNADILNRYLNLSITENSGIRSEHRLTAFISVYSSTPANVIVALNFLLNNYIAAANAYGGVNVVENLLINMSPSFVSESHTNSLSSFIALQGDLVGGVNTTVARRALAIAEENIAWLENYEDDIVNWIQAQTSAGNSMFNLSSILLAFVITISNLLR